jgi:hypothetical protein
MPRQAAAAAAEAVTEVEEDAEPGDQEERWARLLPELLSEVVRRVEASGCERWPARKDVVSCACVCRRWRDAAVAVVRPPAESGKITFPSSLKQVRTEDGSCCLGYVARACSVNRGTQLPIQCAMVWLCAFYGRF